MAYIYDLVDSWSSAGTTFTAIKMNVTDTQSSASSLLMDLQVGTVSKFKVDKSGQATLTNLIATNLYAGSLVQLTAIAGRFDIGGDTFLTRSAAANLRLGAADAAAPVAQTLSVQSVATGTANTAGANFTIAGSRGTGTGAGGSIVFQVAPATTNGSTPNSLADAMTIDSTRSVYIERYLRTRNNIFAILDDGNSILQMGSTVRLGWTAGGSYGPSADTILQRDAANILAQRNSTVAQTFRTYISYVDGSNYSRIAVGNIGSAYGISSEAVGSETIQAFRIRVAGNQNIWFETNNVSRSFIDYAGNFGFGTNAVGDNTYDLGFTVYGNNRPRDVGVGRNILQGSGYYQIAESTAPAAPAVDNVRIYAEDNGSGKTRLMARFASGAAVQIAIEP